MRVYNKDSQPAGLVVFELGMVNHYDITLPLFCGCWLSVLVSTCVWIICIKTAEKSTTEHSTVALTMIRTSCSAVFCCILLYNVVNVPYYTEQMKAEQDHESRNVIAIEGPKFVIHKRTKINHFTEMQVSPLRKAPCTDNVSTTYFKTQTCMYL